MPQKVWLVVVVTNDLIHCRAVSPNDISNRWIVDKYVVVHGAKGSTQVKETQQSPDLSPPHPVCLTILSPVPFQSTDAGGRQTGAWAPDLHH